MGTEHGFDHGLGVSIHMDFGVVGEAVSVTLVGMSLGVSGTSILPTDKDDDRAIRFAMIQAPPLGFAWNCKT